MRALIVGPPNSEMNAPSVAVGDAPEPRFGALDVVIQTAYTGICGSDFALCGSDSGFRGPQRLPVILGHEASGVVVATGESVSRVQIGTIVAVESVLPCGVCDLCLAGYRNECSRIELLGLTKDGSLAERFVVPESACHDLSPLLDAGFDLDCALSTGALIEVFGCVFRALVVDARHALLGSTVVIHGLGPIGVAAVLMARLAGAARIMGIDPLPHRRAFASELGVDAAFHPSDAVPCIHDILKGDGADVQLDATDDTSGIAIAESLAAARGELVLMSRAKERLDVDCGGLISRGISIRGSRGQSGHRIYARLIDLVAARRLTPSKLVSAIVGLEEVAYLLQNERYAAAGKVLVRTSMARKEAL